MDSFNPLDTIWGTHYGAPAFKVPIPGIQEEVGLNERDPHGDMSELDARIKKLRAENEPKSEQSLSGAGVAFRIGIDLISGVAFGVIVGLLLDKWWETTPWMLITMIILGTAAGIRNVIRTAATLNEKD
jgi:ATP synthase protein I